MFAKSSMVSGALLVVQTAGLMLIVIANLGILGVLLCVIGWQGFLFVGFITGSAISGILNK